MQKYEYVPKGSNIALKILDREMQKGSKSKFMVYYDPDIDGLLAGYIAQRFLYKFGKNPMFYINQNREHGFKMTDAELESIKGFTLIAVDFFMSREDIQKVLSYGVNIVNIDHHTIEDTFIHEKNEETGCEGVVINNQYPWEPEEFEFLSGAGVVHYVLQHINKKLGLDTEDKEEEALVGITLLSDVRPTEGLIAQEFLRTTFSHESNYLKYLVKLVTKENGYERYDSFGVPCLNRNFIDYVFSPHFNALFRVNKGNDAIYLINGDPTKVKEYREGNALFAFRDIQNAITDNIIANLKGSEFSSVIVKGIKHDLPINTNYRLSNFIGLACSRVRGDSKTTFLYVESEREGIIQRGSVRGLYDNVDYLGIFKKAGFKAAGHKNAFGVLETDISKINLELLNEEIEKAEKLAKSIGKDNRRVLETSSLTLFLKGPNKKIAYINTMVRDSYRVYLKYTGTNIESTRRGKMIEYTVDGIPVKCFDLELNLDNGVILPIYGKSDYIEFTLRRAIN